jgi:hypothetical protein
MGEEYRKIKRERVARQNPNAAMLADNPLADTMSDSLSLKDRPELPVPVAVELPEVEEVKAEEKGFSGTSYWQPYGGALSFDELEAYQKTMAEVEHMESVTYQFRSIIENVLYNDDVAHNEKAIMIQTAASVYTGRLQSFEYEKSFLDKVKQFFGKKEKVLPDSAMGVIKTKDGHRWFGHYTNNYKDREGETISAEAHKEFVAFVKQNPDRMPLFRSWHLKGTDREKEADFLEYFDGFLVASGPLTKKEAEELEKAIAYDDGQTGMSHGLYVLARDPQDKNVITRYRSFEVSDLPLANAANGFTGINTKEANMADAKFERLKATIGEEAAKKVVDQIGDSKEVLEELGVESKEEEIVAEEKEEVEEEVAEEVVEEVEEAKETESAVKELAMAIVEELKLKDLSDVILEQGKTIKSLVKTVSSLQKEEDEKVADLIEDKSIGGQLWKASEADDNLVPDDEAELIAKPNAELAWVEEVM